MVVSVSPVSLLFGMENISYIPALIKISIAFFFFFPPSSSLSPKDKELCPRILKQNMTYLNQNTSEHQALILF